MSGHLMALIVGFCIGEMLKEYWLYHRRWKRDRQLVDGVILRCYMKYLNEGRWWER